MRNYRLHSWFWTKNFLFLAAVVCFFWLLAIRFYVFRVRVPTNSIYLDSPAEFQQVVLAAGTENFFFRGRNDAVVALVNNCPSDLYATLCMPLASEFSGHYFQRGCNDGELSTGPGCCAVPGAASAVCRNTNVPNTTTCHTLTVPQLLVCGTPKPQNTAIVYRCPPTSPATVIPDPSGDKTLDEFIPNVTCKTVSINYTALQNLYDYGRFGDPGFRMLSQNRFSNQLQQRVSWKDKVFERSGAFTGYATNALFPGCYGTGCHRTLAQPLVTPFGYYLYPGLTDKDPQYQPSLIQPAKLGLMVRNQVFVLTGKWGKSFQHFVQDLLPFLCYLADELQQRKNVTLMLPDMPDMPILLHWLGLENQVEIIPDGPHFMTAVFARELYYSDYYPNSYWMAHHHPSAPFYDSCRSKLTKTLDLKLPRTHILLLSRNDVQSRKVTNEKQILLDVESWLQRHERTEEVILFQGTEQSLEDSLALFSSALGIIGVHGGAFYNMITMQPGSFVIEIRAEINRMVSFRAMAGQLDLKYVSRLVPDFDHNSPTVYLDRRIVLGALDEVFAKTKQSPA